MSRTWRFLWTTPFFGLSPEYTKQLHESIFNLVTFGKGGWTWSDVYNLPIHLRAFYMKQLSSILEKETEALKKGKHSKNGKITPPPHVAKARDSK